jgi:hypothetical protein
MFAKVGPESPGRSGGHGTRALIELGVLDAAIIEI